MRFIEFLENYDGQAGSYLRAVPEKDILEIQEECNGGCIIFLQEPESVDTITSPTPYQNILNQLNGYTPHDYGDVYGIRASEIAAVQEGDAPYKRVIIHLKNGKMLDRSDISLQEFLAAWREG